MTKSNDITKTIPAALASKIGNLTDIMSACYDSGFEDGFRDGKREGQTHALRRRRELAEAWNDHGQPLVTGIKNAIGDGDQTGMHGEPLFESEQPQPKPAKKVASRKVRITAKHREIVALLSEGRWLAAPTIAGLTNLQRITVWNYLNEIKHSGLYKLEERKVKQVDRNKRGYTKLWRVATAA